MLEKLFWLPWVLSMLVMGWFSVSDVRTSPPPALSVCPAVHSPCFQHSLCEVSRNFSMRSLVVMAVGDKGKSTASAFIQHLGFANFDYMLFHYDSSDWSKVEWIDSVISVRYPGHMKWWYIQRFVTPLEAHKYEFIWVVDDDAGVESIPPLEFLGLLRRQNISMAQPAQRAPGGWWSINKQQHHSRESHRVGRWVNFVETGPLIVFRRDLYSQCVWPFIQEDLTSGYGLDSMLAQHCTQQLGASRFAVIDRYPMDHFDLKTASSSKGGKRKLLYDPMAEMRAYEQRFPHLQVNLDRDGYSTLGYITDTAAE